ncbi:uncharacterized protein F4822DRAFT_374654 [Hypoxylon trugodes]|uniref:uncharacterized protein n=1 Tax=Hypoxylon trugodes TaxID=326681 RepID=UPI0021952446|nr:uncharacterized protein F4822DRAFT_374654 [Hypoxylon trugodes]KAI1384841.1 hypothetical protein F4822DRAFT_374654 [Hypoxylon trugodes]
MRSHMGLSLLCSFLLLASGMAQTASSTSDVGPTGTSTDATASQTQATSTDTITGTGSDTSTVSSSSGTSTGGSSGSGTTTGAPSYGSNPPDVNLKVPELHVGRIELDVDNLNAEINLAAQIANLVEINAGVQVGVTKVNITIADVDANLDLVIRLGNLVDIVNRTLESLNLNPLLINVLNEVTDLVDVVVGAVDGLLGSIVNGDSKINFLIDNLGNIVQEVEGAAGTLLSSIVGNYEQNMTYTGAQEILDGGLIQKTFKYDALNALVNIIFNSVGQVVQAVVVKGGGDGGSTTSSTVAATSTPAARR